MNAKPRSITLLMADDDPDDRMMAQEALEESRLVNNLAFVEDGVDLMDYLHRTGEYEALVNEPLPGLILLDLNMPKKSGLEALKEIKDDPQLRTIPVIVLTTSKAEADIFRSYELGVNSFITKPVSFEGLVETLRTLTAYWLDIVELPINRRAA
jgi:CheY-like chemotaxis protein